MQPAFTAGNECASMWMASWGEEDDDGRWWRGRRLHPATDKNRLPFCALFAVYLFPVLLRCVSFICWDGIIQERCVLKREGWNGDHSVDTGLELEGLNVLARHSRSRSRRGIKKEDRKTRYVPFYRARWVHNERSVSVYREILPVESPQVHKAQSYITHPPSCLMWGGWCNPF